MMSLGITNQTEYSSLHPSIRNLEDLFARGLTYQDDAKILGISWLKPIQTTALSDNYPLTTALKISYFAPDGTDLKFHRIRRLDVLNGFSVLTEKKSPKYLQPPKTGSCAYWPRNIDWSKIFKGNDAIIITEGELKAACACKFGFPTIGLGGVWSWRSAKNNQPLIPSLTPAGFNWKGRQIYIVFDSDQSSNPEDRKSVV